MPTEKTENSADAFQNKRVIKLH